MLEPPGALGRGGDGPGAARALPWVLLGIGEGSTRDHPLGPWRGVRRGSFSSDGRRSYGASVACWAGGAGGRRWHVAHPNVGLEHILVLVSAESSVVGGPAVAGLIDRSLRAASGMRWCCCSGAGWGVRVSGVVSASGGRCGWWPGGARVRCVWTCVACQDEQGKLGPSRRDV